MRTFHLLRVFVFLSLFFCSPAVAKESPATFKDAFSPKQGATQLVIKTISSAKKSVHVAAYSFTSRPIADALVQTYQRGVDVKVVLDKSQRKAQSGMFLYLKEKGIPVQINSHYAIMHNKFMIIDGKTLQLGSFNYTDAAEKKNAENVLVIKRSPKVVADYSRQWKKLWEESK